MRNKLYRRKQAIRERVKRATNLFTDKVAVGTTRLKVLKEWKWLKYFSKRKERIELLKESESVKPTTYESREKANKEKLKEELINTE